MFTIFSRDLKSKETNTYETKARRLHSQILIFDFSSFIFKKNYVLTKDNPSEKNVIGEEEREGIDIDGIRNLQGLLR